jgi:hypothetical protein
VLESNGYGVGRVDVLEPTQHLVYEVLHMVVGEVDSRQQTRADKSRQEQTRADRSRHLTW